MRNKVFGGTNITLTAPTGGVIGGMMVVIGALVGIAQSDAEEGELFAMNVGGVINYKVKDGETPDVGDEVGYDEGDNSLSVSADPKIAAVVTPLDADGNVGVLMTSNPAAPVEEVQQ